MTTRRPDWLRWVAAAALFSWILLAALPTVVAAAASGKLAVATENETVSRAAMSVLRSGGNAVDAAVTAAFVAGVASPASSGIGGGGFVLVWDAAKRSVTVIDFRETAPKQVDPEPFENRPFPPAERARATGVPGEVAGLFETHRRFGSKPWADLVRPAIEAANRGYPVSPHVAAVLGFMNKAIEPEPALRELFYPRGRAAAAGTRIRNPKLAATLSRIAAEGPRALYEGPIAADLVAAAAAAGGSLSLEDLAGYRPVERQPLKVSWEGHDVYTMGAPSAGGLLLAQTLGLFSRAELARLSFGSGPYVHILAEAMRGSIADRLRYVGDPELEPVDLAQLASPARLSRRKARLAYGRTHALPRFELPEHGTHHIVTADAEGNVASLTTTVNRPFGARVVGRASGVVLNDELEDFTPRKAVERFGLSRSPNRPRPLARPVSSMTPTLVVRGGKAVLAIGGSGGMTIAPNVTQVLLSHLVFGLPIQAAVKAPRFAIPTGGATISMEAELRKAIGTDLEWRGEIVSTQRFTAHGVQAVAIDDGKVTAASDPRKFGVALVH